MKGKAEHTEAAEPAPVDGLEVVDKKDLVKAMADVFDGAVREIGYVDKRTNERIGKLEEKVKMTAVVGGVIAAALCFVMILRKGD